MDAIVSPAVYQIPALAMPGGASNENQFQKRKKGTGRWPPRGYPLAIQTAGVASGRIQAWFIARWGVAKN